MAAVNADSYMKFSLHLSKEAKDFFVVWKKIDFYSMMQPNMGGQI